MVFGKKRPNVQDDTDSVTHISGTPGFVHLDDDEVEQHIGASSGSQTSTGGASGSNTQTSNEEQDPSKPLYDEVTLISAANSKNPGGSKNWKCNHCGGQWFSSYTRIHVHFFGSSLGKKVDIKRCPAVIRDRSLFERLLKKVKEAENSSVSKSLKPSILSKNSSSKSRIEESFGILERNVVDLKIIRGLCANGIPFNVLRNPQFIEMINAIKHAPESYKPPSSEKARTVLLDECVRDVEKELTPIKDTWYTQGVSIVSDGWSNVKHEPLINVLAVNSRGATFMFADNFIGVEKIGLVISQFLNGAIEQIGPSNVLQVVTDNAANCKAAGKEIEKVYKHIFWSPCCVHTLNLIFKDFAKEFCWMRDTYKKGKSIVKYFLNHTHVLAIFRENFKLELLKVAKTRFASHYILLRRLLDCREALATTIVLNSWREWVKNGDENTRKIGGIVADAIKDDGFWDDVENILAFTKPIFLMVKFCDGEGPKMGEIYERMDNMLGEIKDVMKVNKFSIYYSEVESIVEARWEKMTIPLHCLGFALSPRFYDKNYLQKLAPGGMQRKAPNSDIEIVNGVMDALKRIAEDESEFQLLREQFTRFHMKKGIYARTATQADAVTMDAIDWCGTYSAETPELAEVAKRVLSQPISSSSAERNWITYSYIHNVKRNRLNAKRADKLVFIHSNIRLQSRFSESYKSGPNKKWDMNPESAYIEGSSARLEEMAWEDLEDEGVDKKGKKQRLD